MRNLKRSLLCSFIFAAFSLTGQSAQARGTQGTPDTGNRFAAGDIFPSLEEAYSDALYIEPETFFGGQVTRKLYVDMVKQIPTAYVYGPHYSEMNGFVATAIQKVATGAMSAKDALKEAADVLK